MRNFFQDPPSEQSAESADLAEATVESVQETTEAVTGYAEQAQAFVMDAIPGLVAGVLVLVLGLFVVRIAGRIIRGLLGRSGKMEESLKRFLTGVITTFLKVMVVIAAIGQMGVETASFVAVLASAGLAIGLALQGSLANFASGVLILLFKPFREGDLVEIAGKLGRVTDVGLIAITMDTPQNRRVIIGNSTVMSSVIENLTVNGMLRVDMTFGISYEDDADRAAEILRGILMSDERVMKEPEPIIGMSSHSASSIDIVCRPYVIPDDYWSVWFDTHSKVKKAFDEQDITIPFPQRDVHLHQVPAAPSANAAQ